MITKAQSSEKIINLISKQEDISDREATSVTAALLVLDNKGRCRFTLKQKGIYERVSNTLESENIPFTRPRIKNGYAISLYYSPDVKVG